MRNPWTVEDAVATLTIVKHGIEFVSKLSIVDLEEASRRRWHINIKSGKPYLREGKKKHLHRIIMGEPCGMVVDHMDGDTLNNLRSNLRICTIQENSQNKASHNQFGYKGVRINRQGKFCSSIKGPDGKVYYTKVKDTAVEAALDYNKLAQRLFGEFAKLNVFTKSSGEDLLG